MPNPNARIGLVRVLDPPPDRTSPEQRTTSVEFEDGQRFTIDSADGRSVAVAEILDRLKTLRRPAYIEVAPGTNTINRVFIPIIAKVLSLNQIDERAIEVELDPSHAVHLLQRENPDFTEFEQLLRAANRTGELVLLIEDRRHNIIDVRSFRPGPDGPIPPIPQSDSPFIPSSPAQRFLDMIERIWRRWFCFGCTSLATAQQVFDGLKATSCDPLAVPAPCIPFLYPDDGCWARAHEMCRLMIQQGFKPRKVWNESVQGLGGLSASTQNHPDCYVTWNYHVAPTLCVRGPGFFKCHEMVLDPALFNSPVTKQTWKDKQTNLNSTLRETDASIYSRSGGTDPNYIATNFYLEVYRLVLQDRALYDGPPPYAYCPVT